MARLHCFGYQVPLVSLGVAFCGRIALGRCGVFGYVEALDKRVM